MLVESSSSFEHSFSVLYLLVKSSWKSLSEILEIFSRGIANTFEDHKIQFGVKMDKGRDLWVN